MLTVNDLGGGFVPASGHLHVDKGDDPSNEELRERKEVGDVHLAPDLRLHEVGEIPVEHWERKEVKQGEHGAAHDELLLPRQEGLELRLGLQGCPGGDIFVGLVTHAARRLGSPPEFGKNGNEGTPHG